jgi:hypothetical protein
LRRLSRIAPTFAVLALIASVACVSARDTRPPGDDPLADFKQRVDSYMELHNTLEKQGPPMKTTADQAAIRASQQALAARIQAARANAKQGDVFTPAVATKLRQLLNPELRGTQSAGTRASIREATPAEFTLKVNGSYPENAPLSTVPPNVLQVLPSLPEDLQYRIVSRHLILHDVHANIVVDFLYDVMCDKC